MLYGFTSKLIQSIIKSILNVLSRKFKNLFKVINIKSYVALITDGVKLVRNI